MQVQHILYLQAENMLVIHRKPATNFKHFLKINSKNTLSKYVQERIYNIYDKTNKKNFWQHRNNETIPRNADTLLISIILIPKVWNHKLQECEHQSHILYLHILYLYSYYVWIHTAYVSLKIKWKCYIMLWGMVTQW